MNPVRSNSEIAYIFGRLADLIELGGGNHFKVQAYRKGQEVLAGFEGDVLDCYQVGRLSKITGLGPALSKKVVEYRETGKITKLEQLVSQFPVGLTDLLDLPGISPRILHRINRELGVNSIDDLRMALTDGRLMEMGGIARERKEAIARSLADNL